MKIAIIGASGFLGMKLFNYFSEKHEVIGTYSKNKRDNLVELDATNSEDVEKFLLHYNPDVVIDTIALSSSVACEKDPDLCRLLNYTTAKNIVEACKKIGAKMIFISSNYIFDGEKGDYTEEDQTNPKNEYGKKKILAEEEISKLDNYLIIRSSMMYGENDNQLRFGTGTFNQNIIQIGSPNQIRSPIFVDDIPKAIDFLLEKKQNGIFHFGGPEKIPIFDFLKKLGSLIGKEENVKIVDSSDFVLDPPKNPSLNSSKIENLGFKFHSLEEVSEILKNNLKINHY